VLLREPGDERIVDYLLRRMTEGDRECYEREYFSNHLAHEQLLAVECELIDAYLSGELPAAERRDFERVYLATPEMRARVVDARSFKACLPNEPTLPHAVGRTVRMTVRVGFKLL
jgi:hypothetical protein